MRDSYVSERPLPRRLAAYIATSAFRSRSSAFSPGGRGGDADAGGHLHLVPAQRERMAHRGREALEQLAPALGAGRVLQQDGELVAAQPGHGVGRAGAGEEALRRRDQQAVALAVAQAVVHPLEVVQVHEEDRDRVRLPLRQRQRVAHAVAEQGAVGEAGERVVEGLVGELLLQALPLADVAGVEHDAAHGRVTREVGRQDLGAEPRAVGLAEPPLDRSGDARRPRGDLEQRGGALPVVGMEQGRDRPAHHLGRVVAEHPVGRRAHEPHAAVGPGHDDHVRRVLHQRAEPRLVLPHRLVGQEADVLPHRQELPHHDEQRHQQRADGEPADRIGPRPERRVEQQPVGRGDGEVGERAHRLRPLPRRAALGRLGHRPAVVQLRAGDQHDVAEQVRAVDDAGAPAARSPARSG